MEDCGALRRGYRSEEIFACEGEVCGRGAFYRRERINRFPLLSLGQKDFYHIGICSFEKGSLTPRNLE